MTAQAARLAIVFCRSPLFVAFPVNFPAEAEAWWLLYSATVNCVKYIKNCKNVHWLYIVKTFELSAVRLLPPMDMNAKKTTAIYTKIGETIKKEYIKTGKKIKVSKKLIIF